MTQIMMQNRPGGRYQIPPAMRKAWAWVEALHCWDYGETAPLAALVRNEPIPDELRPILADIVSEKRQPRLKATQKLKIPPGERLALARSLFFWLKHCFALEQNLATETLEEYCDGQGIEQDKVPREEVDKRREIARKLQADAAENWGVSEETVKNMLGELRKKINNYPNI